MKLIRSLTAKYLYISLILLSFMGLYVYGEYLFTRHQKEDEKRIDLAGRERMLTLNMAFHTLLIIELPSSRDEEHLINMAEKTMNEYEEILYGIKYGNEELELAPIPHSDTLSIKNVDILIDTWKEVQRPAMINMMGLPEERKDASCEMCHDAIRENMGKINDLVKSLEYNYTNEIRRFDKLRMYTLIFFFITGALLFLYVKKHLVSPVIVLRDAASKVELRDFNVAVDAGSKDEIGDLSRSFNQMVRALDETFTENSKLVTRLEEAKITAEAANHAKSDFLANVSHELRTPLNAVMGFSEIIRDGMAGPVTDEQKEYLTDIIDSGQHLLDLINDILDLSKIEAGKVELEETEFDFRSLVSRSLDMFREKAFKHKLEAEFEIEDGIGNITADERRLKQVLFNLLSNAFKFTKDGGRITVRARHVPEEQQQIECSVEDTGIGIREEDKARLFRPFEQLETTLTKEHGGTGLGLALCRKIVELHGGNIWVESEFGKGSRFIFRIPERRPSVGPERT